MINTKGFTVALLIRHFKELKNNCSLICSLDLVNNNLFEWEISFRGPKHTLYENGIFRVNLKFPTDFPEHPPVMYFKTQMWHPNIYPDGKVCISILHPRDEKENDTDDKISERWRPCATAEQILEAVMAMLSSPNVESPANPAAGTQYMYDRKHYDERVMYLIKKAMEEL